MDLAALKAAFIKPWGRAHQWPIFRWLDPDIPVRVWRVDGSKEVWVGENALSASASAQPKFDAIELPAELFLTRQLVLPEMPPEQLWQAISLDAKTLSPFDPHDLVWGYTSRVEAAGSKRVAHIVLASRKQVDGYLTGRKSQLDIASFEVWAMCSPGVPVVVPGWGEALRQRQRVVRRRLGWVLLSVMVMLVAGLVVTPVAQLRLRAIEAAIAHSELQGRAAPLLMQRETMQQATERIGLIKSVLSERADGVLLLDTLTRALPDDTYLGTLDVTGMKVRIVGLTANSAALMQLLGAQNGFREVRAPVPAVRNPGSSLENFNIEFQLDPLVFSAAVTLPAQVASGATNAAIPSAPDAAASGASTPNAVPAPGGGQGSGSGAPAVKSRFSSGGDTRRPAQPPGPMDGKQNATP